MRDKYKKVLYVTGVVLSSAAVFVSALIAELNIIHEISATVIIVLSLVLLCVMIIAVMYLSPVLARI